MASTGAISRGVPQVRDGEKETMEQLVELFGNTLDYDLIHNVALNCNYQLQTISNILYEMTDSVRKSPRTENLNTISKTTKTNGTAVNQRIQPDVLPKRIADDIKKGYRVMIIMRGLPGSGKSTKAKEIIKSVMGTSNYDEHIFSADDYFICKRTGVYTYNLSKLRDAHEYVQTKVASKAKEGFSPIIVDNTHTLMWEMKCYAGIATNFGYIVEIIEPSTTWAFNERELAKKNVHTVPRIKIQEMLERYQRNISSKELLSSYHLSYTYLKPPVLRKFPPILREEPKLSVRIAPQENIVSNGLSNGGETQTQHQFSLATKVHCKGIPKNIGSPTRNENLPSTTPLLSSQELLRNKGTIELNAVPFSFDSGTMSFGSPQSKTRALENIGVSLQEERKPAIVLKPFAAESHLLQETSNIDIPKPLPKNWKTFQLTENFPNSWKSWEVVSPVVSPVSSTSPGSYELFENRPTTESSSNTLGSDFSILNNGWDNSGNVRIMNTTSRNINEGVKLDQARNVTHKITLDKSSMTSDNAVVTDNDHDIQELMKLFVGVPIVYLKDVYEKCGNNLNWTVDLLLDDNRDILPVFDIAMAQEIASTSDNNDMVPLIEAVEENPIQDISASADNNENSAINQDIQMLKTLFCNLSVDYLIDAYKKGGNKLESTVDYILNDDNGDEKKSKYSLMNELTMTGEDERSKPPLRESEELKKHIEENVVINKDYYSEHVLKLKDRQNGVSTSVDSLSPSPSGTTNSEEFVFIERGISQNEFEEEERMELNLGANLISQLEAKFGCLNMIPQGFQPVINIPTDLAKQLHAFYVESIFVQMENQTQVLEMLVKEDEEFAKKLQREEETVVQGGEPLSLNTIMKDQLASSLQQRDIEEWVQQNSRDDLASKLTLHNLTSTFPSVSKPLIMEILMAYNYSYEDTVEALRASIDSDEESNPPAPIPQEIVKSMQVAQQELDKECQEDNYNKTAEEYRQEAQMHLAKHHETMLTAQQACQRKQFQVAQFYSDLAKSHTKLYEKANGMAAAAFIEQNASRLNQLNVLDLHNLYVKEALQALDLFIDVNVNTLRESNRTSQELSIITGRGKNSADGRSKLRPAVQSRLRKRNILFNAYSFNPGMIRIKINTSTVLTSDL